MKHVAGKCCPRPPIAISAHVQAQRRQAYACMHPMITRITAKSCLGCNQTHRRHTAPSRPPPDRWALGTRDRPHGTGTGIRLFNDCADARRSVPQSGTTPAGAGCGRAVRPVFQPRATPKKSVVLAVPLASRSPHHTGRATGSGMWWCLALSGSVYVRFVRDASHQAARRGNRLDGSCRTNIYYYY